MLSYVELFYQNSADFGAMLVADNNAILKEYESFNACMPDNLAKIDIERFKSQSSCFEGKCGNAPLGSSAGKFLHAFAFLTTFASFCAVGANFMAKQQKKQYKYEAYRQPERDEVEMPLTEAQRRAQMEQDAMKGDPKQRRKLD